MVSGLQPQIVLAVSLSAGLLASAAYRLSPYPVRISFHGPTAVRPSSVHTDYSLLDGACETSELLDEASRQKMPAVAITDHGNLFAAANFFYEASSATSSPSSAAKVYVAKGSRHERGEKNERRQRPGSGDAEPGMRGSNHLVLLCESLEGYHNLIKLVSPVSRGFLLPPAHRLRLACEAQQGLDRSFRLSARVRLTEAVVDQKYDQARENAYRLRDVFGKRKFFPRNSGSGIAGRKDVNRELVRFRKRPVSRSSLPTIVITSITTTLTPRKCCSASRPAKP